MPIVSMTVASHPAFELNLGAVRKVVAMTIESQILEGFARSRDPYGNPWKPLSRRDGMPLIDTGVMRGSVRVDPDFGGVTIDKDYASYHQTGTRDIPARKMIADAGPSPIWERAIEGALDAMVEAELLK